MITKFAIATITSFLLLLPVSAASEKQKVWIPGEKISAEAKKTQNNVQHIEDLSAEPVQANLDEVFTKPISVKFEQSEWLKPESRNKWLMVYDLVHSNKLIGMNRKQTFELLGAATADEYTRSFASDRNVHAYQLRSGFYFQLLYLDNRVFAYRLKVDAASGRPTFAYSHWITKNF